MIGAWLLLVPLGTVAFLIVYGKPKSRGTWGKVRKVTRTASSWRLRCRCGRAKSRNAKRCKRCYDRNERSRNAAARRRRGW